MSIKNKKSVHFSMLVRPFHTGSLVWDSVKNSRTKKYFTNEKKWSEVMKWVQRKESEQFSALTFEADYLARAPTGGKHVQGHGTANWSRHSA